MSTLSPELRSKVELWRQKTKDGTITLAEMKEGILLLRGDRKVALEASAGAKGGSKAKRPARSADDMLAEFE